MDQKKFTALLTKSAYSADDLDYLDQLITKYPWFELPRFLRLKALKQLNSDSFDAELKNAIIYTGDRKRLHEWLFEDIASESPASKYYGNELEFIDLNDDREEDSDPGSDIESVLGSEENSDADKAVIREKDETEMEDPEIEPSMDLPVIESLEDDQKSEEAVSTTESAALSAEDTLKPDSLVPGEESPESQKDRVPEYEGQINDDEPGRMTPSADIPGTETSEEEEDDNGEDGNFSSKIIEDFLNQNPGIIKADKQTSLEGDISKDSVKEDDSNITDTLAKIYVMQGLHAKAIYAYERLSLKYPEKSAYFAAQIEKIKSISNL